MVPWQSVSKQKVFLFGFLLILPSTFLFINKSVPKHYKALFAFRDSQKNQFESKIAHSSLLPWIDTKILNAAEAKTNKKFWAVEVEDYKGVALDALSDENIFNALYPGYPQAMRLDQNLWKNYFTRDFESSIWSKTITDKVGFPVSVYQTWTGCFDIIKRYGADIVILGNSDVFRGVVPDYLFTLLNKTNIAHLKNPRILVCSAGGFPIATTGMIAKEIARIQKQPHSIKYIIWGFSFWITYLNSQVIQHFDQNQANNFNVYYLSKIIKTDFFRQWLSSYQSYSLAQVFPAISWNNLMPYSFQEIRELTVNSQLQQTGVLRPVPVAIANNPKKLLQLVEKIQPSYGDLNQATQADCDLAKAEKVIDGVFKDFDTIAENSLIYLTPANPILTKAAPACLFENTKKLLQKKNTKNRQIQTLNWREYGLDYKHYLRATSQPNILSIDGNHLYLPGAMIVTKKLAGFITNQELRKNE